MYVVRIREVPRHTHVINLCIDLAIALTGHIMTDTLGWAALSILSFFALIDFPNFECSYCTLCFIVYKVQMAKRNNALLTSMATVEDIFVLGISTGKNCFGEIKILNEHRDI